ncbi:hypothetical protein BDV96DRAFT_692941 [Lophiotrema nucula]|uniref:F-box domain-containing protein n=1 Tax=Lophiotrema nucula TaxID=690887 RepID=A0A6A5YLK1_9PLEO|nr:hypothetical protein BDV96DRAFT_692941 [Lophiotrema nucula]
MPAISMGHSGRESLALDKFSKVFHDRLPRELRDEVYSYLDFPTLSCSGLDNEVLKEAAQWYYENSTDLRIACPAEIKSFLNRGCANGCNIPLWPFQLRALTVDIPTSSVYLQNFDRRRSTLHGKGNFRLLSGLHVRHDFKLNICIKLSSFESIQELCEIGHQLRGVIPPLEQRGIAVTVRGGSDSQSVQPIDVKHMVGASFTDWCGFLLEKWDCF